MHYRMPKPSEIWRHCNGTSYQILTLAMNVDNAEPVVVYSEPFATTEGVPRVYVRRLNDFLSYTDDKRPRFTLLHERPTEGE